MSSRTTQVEVIVFKIIENQILFLLLKRNEQKGGFWQPVTGGVEGEEEIAAAANRELREETGITEYVRLINNVHYFEFNTEEHGILKEHVFGVEIDPSAVIQLSYEHTEYKWCSIDESLTLLKYENNKIAFNKLTALLTVV